ncbi:MAG: hypothetical protein N2255_06250 [Kiritimatiellae bacterium]|nr:hypothetical protein [Kiritimatiellia bacterium]
MLRSHKVSLSPDLYERVKKLAEVAGYSSVDEFVIHLLEKAVADLDESLSEEEVRKRLKGLGYIG